MSFGSSVHAGVLLGRGSKLCLSLAIELYLKDPDLFRCCQTHRQSPDLLSLQKRTRSQGPSLYRSYPASLVLCPCPTPAAAATCDVGVRGATLAATGLPRYPDRLPNVPCPLPRWTERVHVSMLPHPRGLPRLPGGSASTIHFRGLSLALRPARLLNRPRRPLSRGFDPASYPAKPLVSYQTDRLLSGWNLPPLVTRAFGAHR